jgi:hypothetical protein
MRQFSIAFDMSPARTDAEKSAPTRYWCGSRIAKALARIFATAAAEAGQGALVDRGFAQPTLYSFASDPHWGAASGSRSGFSLAMRRRMNVAIVAV